MHPSRVTVVKICPLYNLLELLEIYIYITTVLLLSSSVSSAVKNMYVVFAKVSSWNCSYLGNCRGNV